MPNVFTENGLRTSVFDPYNKTDAFEEVTIVTDEGHVQIPSDWVTLMPDEDILTAHGECYKMRLIDYLFSLCTLCCYYCCFIAPKRNDRTAIILTNKRIIVMVSLN